MASSSSAIHFVGSSRNSTSLQMSALSEHLQFKVEGPTTATLRGPSTAFHVLAVQGKADVDFLEGRPPLAFKFVFDRRRCPDQGKHGHIPDVRDWLGVLLKCDTLELAFVVDGTALESGRWLLQLRGLRGKAVTASRSVCRYGCGMAVNGARDTCCRKCTTSRGAGGHDGDCAGPGPADAIAEFQRAADLSGLRSAAERTHTAAAPSAGPTPRACDAPSAPDLGKLPYGGDIQQAMRANDRDAIRTIMEARAAAREVATASTSSSGHAPRCTPRAPKAGASCAICFDDLPASAMAVCSAAHGFCTPCLGQHVQTELEEKGVLPACPLSAECGHLLTHAQVEQVLAAAGKPKTVLDLFVLLQQRAGLKALGAVACSNCEDWIVPSSQGGRQALLECPSCRDRSCGKCRRRPYHFRVTCEDVPEVEHIWHEWLRKDRDAYLNELAREDTQYMTTLKEFETKKAEQARMLQEADAREAEFLEMERWKASRCKCCPKCHRVIEKIDGCDSMKCGQNYHGGDVQNGCGHQFNWSSAAPYKPKTKADHVPPAKLKALPPPAQRQKLQWQVQDGVYLICAMCKKTIEGPCFLCIDCFACCACLKCANGFGASSGGKHVPETHTFEILWHRKDLKDRDLLVLADNHLTRAMALCTRPGCRKPTWNGRPNGYCSKPCRDGLPPDTPICGRPGCGRPTWDGNPGSFCGKRCRDSTASMGAPQHDLRARPICAVRCEECGTTIIPFWGSASACVRCHRVLCGTCGDVAKRPCPGSS